MASFVTPANGDDALAEHIAQITENFSGLRNIPISLTGINDASAYAQTTKNAGTGSKALIIYAADGTTVLFSVDGTGVKASRVGAAAERVLTTGEVGTITAAMLDVGIGVTVKRKTADETVTSSTTLQDDNDLTFTVGATETWIFEGLLVVTGPDAADIKIAIACSGATALAWSAVGPASSLGATATSSDGQFIAETTLGQSRVWGTSSTTQFIGIQIRGLVTGGGSPATCAIQWAQQVSDAGAVTMRAGSHIIVRRVT